MTCVPASWAVSPEEEEGILVMNVLLPGRWTRDLVRWSGNVHEGCRGRWTVRDRVHGGVMMLLTGSGAWGRVGGVSHHRT